MLINTDQYRLNKNVIKTIYSSINNNHKISKSTSYCLLTVKNPNPSPTKLPPVEPTQLSSHSSHLPHLYSYQSSMGVDFVCYI